MLIQKSHNVRKGAGKDLLLDAVKSKANNNVNRQIKLRNEPVYKSSNFIKKNNKS